MILKEYKILKKKLCLKNMSLNERYFLYYCRISVKDGLNTTLSHVQFEMGNYNKDLYQRCRFYCCILEINKAFKENEDICKFCLKLLEIEVVQNAINPKINVFWKDNQQYRICANIYRSFADSIFRKEYIKDKWNEIPKETLSIHLNSST